MYSKLINWWRTFDQLHRNKAAEIHERELAELQNIFALLVGGSLIGTPFSPIHLQLELLSEMEEELEIMFDKIETANDPLAELFSVFDIG